MDTNSASAVGAWEIFVGSSALNCHGDDEPEEKGGKEEVHSAEEAMEESGIVAISSETGGRSNQ